MQCASKSVNWIERTRYDECIRLRTAKRKSWSAHQHRDLIRDPTPPAD